MLPGSTPINKFTIPFDESEVAGVWVIYSHNGTDLIQKSTPDCTVAGNKVSVKLTQEETLKFLRCANLEIQVWVKTTGGDMVGSNVMTVGVDKSLRTGVL